jgi:hypothetical protein
MELAELSKGSCLCDRRGTEAEFFNLIGTKVFLRHLYKWILLHLPLSKNGLKLVCNVNFVYGKLRSKNSQDYAQKPQ